MEEDKSSKSSSAATFEIEFNRLNIGRDGFSANIKEIGIPEYYAPGTADTSTTALVFFIYFCNQLFASFALSMFQASIPLILINNGAGLADLGLLTISNYPFSLQFLAGPILDRYFSVKIGKRMSYIIPCLYAFLILFMYAGFTVDRYVGTISTINIAIMALLMVLNAAILIISSDGYFVTIIPSEKRSYLSMLKQVAGTTGWFISYNIFIPLNNLDFSNKHIYKQAHTEPALTFRSYFLFVSAAVLVYVLFVQFKARKEPSVVENFKSMSQILNMTKGFWTNKHLFRCLLFILIWRIGFAPLEVYFWPLIFKGGFSEVAFIKIVTMLYPFSILLSIFGGYYALQNRKNRFRLLYLHIGVRWITSFLQYWMLKTYTPEDWKGAFWMITLWQVLSMIHFSVFGIATESFFAEACDSRIGTTYMTIYASISNLGDNVPRTVLYFIIGPENWEIITITLWIYAFVLLIFSLPIAKKLSVVRLEELQLDPSTEAKSLINNLER